MCTSTVDVHEVDAVHGRMRVGHGGERVVHLPAQRGALLQHGGGEGEVDEALAAVGAVEGAVV
ncbi:hypothetical protein GCM10020001_019010 [Nonomuraea salmonea]